MYMVIAISMTLHGQFKNTITCLLMSADSEVFVSEAVINTTMNSSIFMLAALVGGFTLQVLR